MNRIWCVIVLISLVGALSPFALAGDKEKKRFELKAYTDGTQTVIDNDTGLEWEVKTDAATSDYPDPTNVQNKYSWAALLHEHPDGSLFTDFLARMNCVIATNHICGPGGHTDWRIPTVAELKTIVDCSFSPCIDPIFGPIRVDDFTLGAFWTGTTVAGSTSSAYIVRFSNGEVSQNVKPGSMFVRAVRGER